MVRHAKSTFVRYIYRQLTTCIDEVVHVVHVGELDAKIIDYQAERDVLPDVAPETRSMLALVIHFDGKVFLE